MSARNDSQEVNQKWDSFEIRLSSLDYYANCAFTHSKQVDQKPKMFDSYFVKSFGKDYVCNSKLR